MTSPFAGLALFNKISTVTKVINAIRAAVSYLEARGLARERITELLATAETEGRDVTDAEVAEAIGAAQEAIDALTAAAEAKQAEDAPAEGAPPPEE